MSDMKTKRYSLIKKKKDYGKQFCFVFNGDGKEITVHNKLLVQKHDCIK